MFIQEVSIIPRQYFQQLNLKTQVAVGLDMLAHRSLAIGQMRRNEQGPYTADLHAHQALVPASSDVTLKADMLSSIRRTHETSYLICTIFQLPTARW